jgi:peroxiredoxin Q/BCP
MKAPDFNLPDQNGNLHKLEDYKGKWLILYFYPKDDTPGCTKEACNFRDASNDYKKLGVSIIGISKDSIKSHQKFAEKHKLNFPLLADEDGSVIKSYGAWGEKSMFGKKYMGILRNTYLINPDGEIQKEYKGVKPEIHNKEILKDLNEVIA